MEKISFDNGIREYRINGTGVLKFNPGDPNVYARFLEAMEKIADLEQELSAQAQTKTTAEDALRLMTEADRGIKQILDWVFGHGNSFDKILGGVNLLAVAANGERVITNLLEALQPVLLAGAEECVRETTEKAVQKAKTRRSAQ